MRRRESELELGQGELRRGWRARWKTEASFSIIYVPIGILPLAAMKVWVGLSLADARDFRILVISGLSSLTLLGIIAVLYRQKLQVEVHRKALLEMVTTDPLTGLSNRRALWPALRRASEQADSRGQDVALLVIDLDRFKQVNDELGHSTGDRLLEAFASALRAATRREQDSLFRIGGDEFVVLLGQADDLIARTVAGRIIEYFKKEAEEIAPGRAVGCSVGLGHREPNESPDSWLHRVDQAMYDAKAHGGGLVEADVPEPTTPLIERRARAAAR